MPLKHQFPETSVRAHIIFFRLLYTLIPLTIPSQSIAQSIRLDWVKTLRSSHGTKMVIDSNRAIIVFGAFSGTVDFDPGPAVFNMSAGTGQDLYIAKYDTAGNFLWAKQLSSPFDLFEADMKLDKNGDLLLLGSFQDSVDFDPGPGQAPLTSTYSSGFLLKLDHNGNFLWVKKVAYDLNTMDLDPSGNIILGGSFAGTVDFDPGPGTYNASAAVSNYFDLAVVKLDNAANFIWMKQIRNLDTAQVQTFGIRTDPQGNILFAGNFSSSMDFDPGPGVSALNAAGSDDAFVLKLDAQGNFVWARQFGSAGSDKAFGLEVDKYGNVYTTGTFQNTADFDPGPAVYNLTAGGIRACFISKLDKNGNFGYAKVFQAGSGGSSIGQALAIDSSSNLYISGGFSGPVDFDPGPGVDVSNGSNLFTVKLDSNGNLAWAAPYVGTNGTFFESIWSAVKVDIMKNVYYTGWFVQTVNFDPAGGTYLVSDSTGGSTFIHKLSQCNNTLNIINAESCDTFALNGVTYPSPGLYYQTLTNSVGCDSIIQLTLTRNETFSKLDTTVCGSFVWNGKTLTAGGIYRDTFPSATACDSVAELDLTFSAEYSQIIDTACGAYQWNGASLTASGVYTDTLITANGCDSIVTLQLVVVPKPSPILGKDTVLCSGDTITLTPGTFPDYSWSNNSTANSLIVKDTGTYWVQVTDANGCTASDSIRITSSNLCSCTLSQATTVFPTPFRDYLYINKEHTSCQVRVVLYDMRGQMVKRDIILDDGINRILLSDLAEGMYVFKLYSGGKILMTGKALKLE